MGRRRQGEGRRLADRQRAGCRALPGRAQRRPHAGHRRPQDGAAADPVGRAAQGRRDPDRQRRRAVAVGAAAGDRRARECRRRGALAPEDLSGLPAGAADPRRARPGARGGAGRRQDRHDGTRHRPRLRGQGRAARAARAGPARSRALRRKAREAPRAAQLHAGQLLPARPGRVRGDARCDARAGRRDRTDGRRRRRGDPAGATPRGFAAVRGRPGRAARHRPRHLSLRDKLELRGRRSGPRQRRRPGSARLRARHREGLHDARGHRALPHRARPTKSAPRWRSAATSSARSPAGPGAAAGSTSPRSSVRSS